MRKKVLYSKLQQVASLETIVLLLDFCHFDVVDQIALKGCEGSPGVRGASKGAWGAFAMRGLSPISAACSFKLDL